MATMIALTEAGSSIYVNADQIRTIRSSTAGSTIHFDNDHPIGVRESPKESSRS